MVHKLMSMKKRDTASAYVGWRVPLGVVKPVKTAKSL